MKYSNFFADFISSLTIKEKKMIAKYLAIYSTQKKENYPLNIFQTFLKYKVFNEKRFIVFSKCKNTSHFRKEKSKLKIMCLDFLRINIPSSKQAKWRKYLDYALILQNKTNHFNSESLKFYNNILTETLSDNAHSYTLLSVEEMSWLFGDMLKTNYEEVLKYVSIQNNVINKIYDSKNVIDYFNEVMQMYTQYSFIKSTEIERKVLQLEEKEYFSIDIKSFEDEQQRLFMLYVRASIYYLKNEKKKFSKVLFYLISFNNSLDENSPIANSEFRKIYFTYVLNGLLYLKEYKMLMKILKEFKSLLDNYFPKIENEYLHWARYFDYEFNYKLKFSLITKEDIEIFELFILKNKDHYPKRIIQQLYFSLCKAYLRLHNYKKVVSVAVDIYDVKNCDDISKSFSDIARIFEIMFMYKQYQNEIGMTLKNIEFVANKHYLYFIKKDKKYHKMEIQICLFFKTFSKKKGKGIVEEFKKLERKIRKIEQEEEYGFIEKFNSKYFNIYKLLFP